MKVNFSSLKLENQPVTLATIYASNESQISFKTNTLEELTKIQEREVIVGGGFNLIID